MQHQAHARSHSQMAPESHYGNPDCKINTNTLQMTPEAYEKLVVAENWNREVAEGLHARSVEGALAALGVAEQGEDKHPEK